MNPQYKTLENLEEKYILAIASENNVVYLSKPYASANVSRISTVYLLRNFVY